MRSILLTALIALLALPALAETYYKWVDKNGVTHYSDKPVPGAIKVDIHESRPSSSPPPPVSSYPGSTTTPAAEFKYRSLDLYRPKNDEVFVNAGNTVSVSLRVDPVLQPGHTIWLYFDGKRLDGQSGAALEFQINDVYRGTHTVVATVTDSSGKQLISSQTVTFHVRQNSTLTPRPAAGR